MEKIDARFTQYDALVTASESDVVRFIGDAISKRHAQLELACRSIHMAHYAVSEALDGVVVLSDKEQETDPVSPTLYFRANSDSLLTINRPDRDTCTVNISDGSLRLNPLTIGGGVAFNTAFNRTRILQSTNLRLDKQRPDFDFHARIKILEHLTN